MSAGHAVVAVVGPRRSGKSSLLTDWAQMRSHGTGHGGEPPSELVWLEGDDLPQIEDGVIIVDDADRLSPQRWAELGDRIDRYPRLRLRVALRDVRCLPADWEAEVVDDLYFTFAETKEYLEAAGSRLDAGAVAAFTGGHPGAVRSLSLPGVAGPHDFHAALVQVGRRWALDEASLLAVPDHLNADVVAALRGPSSFLDEAEAAGWGRWWGERDSRVFTLIPAVREATRALLDLAEGDRQAVHAQAGAILLKKGSVLPALIDAAHAHDLDLAETALRAEWSSIVTDHAHLLAPLFGPLALDELRGRPALAMAMASVHGGSNGGHPRAVELFRAAIADSRRASVSAEDRPLMRIIESKALRILDEEDGGITAAHEAMNALGSRDVEGWVRRDPLESYLRTHAAISFLQHGSVDDARDQFRLALVANPDAGTELIAVGGLSMLAVLAGDTTGARYWIDHAARRLRRQEGEGRSLLCAAQAQLEIESLDFDSAEETLGRIWPSTDTVEHWPLLAAVRAQIDIATGRSDAGLERLRSVRRKRTADFGMPSLVSLSLDVVESLLLLGAGRPIDARNVLNDVAPHPVVNLAQLRVDLVLEDTEQALARLVAPAPHSPRLRISRLTLEAVLLAQIGRPEPAREVAKRACTLAKGYGLLSPFMLLPHGTLHIFGDFAAHIPGGLPPSEPVPSLTEREHVILRELASTSRADVIASRLHVSVNTVKSQRRSLYNKLGVSSRREALGEAITHGLLG